MGMKMSKNKVKCYNSKCNGKLRYLFYSDIRLGHIYFCNKCSDFTIITKNNISSCRPIKK